LGEYLVREMMNRGMLIDLDHMSTKAVNRTLEIAEAGAGSGREGQARYPGVVMGHTGFLENNKPFANKRAEGNKSARQVDRLRDLGGLMGVILH
jgi:microsomal dipeptidase-like Zn-dependent dipeptidase